MKSSVRARGICLVSTTALSVLAALGFPSPARADVTHTVARGHTVEAIAHRYHVTVKSILDANHLQDGRHLKPGDTLTIPGVQPSASGAGGKSLERDGRGGRDGKDGKSAKALHGKAGKGARPPTYAMRPRTPGVVHAIRLATSESFTVHLADRRGKVSPTTQKSFERMMRSTNNLSHPPDGRIISLVGIVSNHFGSRPLQVISGFRPYASTQRTPHSNHNIGRAIDFRVVGVPNEVVRDYCRTLHNVGVGYYPNSTFVHLDARETPAYWIDYSKPGESPRYNNATATAEADEGTSDVADDAKGAESAPPPPVEPPSASSDDDSEESDTTDAPAEAAAANPAAEPAPKAGPEIPTLPQ